MLAEMGDGIRTIFNAPDRANVKIYLAKAVQKYARTASCLADWMEKNIPEGLTIFSFPSEHRRRIRTSNGSERVNKKIHRCGQVVSIFPNESACV